MSRHIQPHRWADAFAGRLPQGEVTEMDHHADACASCAKARVRVLRVSAALPKLRTQSSPELPWDAVRAKVHWSVSSARHAQHRARGPRVMPFVAAAAMGTAVLAIVLTSSTDAPPVTTQAPAPVVTPPRAPVSTATPLGAVVVRELGQQIMIDGVRAPNAFAEVLDAGTTLATGAGRLDIQFDERNALALGDNTILTLERFDSERVELVLKEGSVDIDIAKRGPDQRFIIKLGDRGDRTVEVRGTHFRISETAGAARIECVHGRVAVRDASGELEVAAAHKLDLAARTLVTNAVVTDLSAMDIAQLVEAAPRTLPVWTSAQQLVTTSAPLEVAMSGKRDVRVDGVEIGQGALRIRVMPGRHSVETADHAGQFRRAGWIDVQASKPARLEALPEAATAPAQSSAATRRNQLRAGIDRARLAMCTRAITKAGVSDIYVRIEIAIDETGAVGFLNVIDTDLPSATASCVRDVLADVRFKSGPAATFRDKLDL